MCESERLGHNKLCKVQVRSDLQNHDGLSDLESINAIPAPVSRTLSEPIAET